MIVRILFILIYKKSLVAFFDYLVIIIVIGYLYHQLCVNTVTTGEFLPFKWKV